MEPECQLPHSQDPGVFSCAESGKSSPVSLRPISWAHNGARFMLHLLSGL